MPSSPCHPPISEGNTTVGSSNVIASSAARTNSVNANSTTDGLLAALQPDLRAVCSPLPTSEAGDDFGAGTACRICLDVIREAYMTSCGHSFCFVCIQQHLSIKPQCPICSAAVDSSQVYPNFTLNRIISDSQHRRGISSSTGSRSPKLNTYEIDVMVSNLLEQKRKLEVMDRLSGLELLGDFLRKTIEEKQNTLAELTTQLRQLNEDMQIVSRLVAPEKEEGDAELLDLELPVSRQRNQQGVRVKKADIRSPKGGNNAQVPDGPCNLHHTNPVQQSRGESNLGVDNIDTPSLHLIGTTAADNRTELGSAAMSMLVLNHSREQNQPNLPLLTETIQSDNNGYTEAESNLNASHVNILTEPRISIREEALDSVAGSSHAQDRIIQAQWNRKRNHSHIDSPPPCNSTPSRNSETPPPTISTEVSKLNLLRLSNSEMFAQRIPRLKVHMEDLQAVYFDWRLDARPSTAGHDLPPDLARFSSSLAKFSKYTRFKTLATARYGEIVVTSQLSIVSSIDFDKDDEFFAAAGVSKKIKIFEYASVVIDPRQLAGYTGGFINRSSRHGRTLKRPRSDRQRLDMDALTNVGSGGETSYNEGHGNAALDQVAADEQPNNGMDDSNCSARPENIPRYPVREMSSRSKISCLSYNAYIKPYLLSSDYEGVVTLWDASMGVALLALDEHEKRTWSVDFSTTDPMRIASGSDDTRVKLWQANQKRSVLTIESKANICSVKFHPSFSHHLAFGSADHHVHYYDLRNSSTPLHVFKGHRKAVSYVKFMNDNEMVSASTDCSLRLWSLKESMAGSSTDIRGRSQSVFARSYSGHTNEKNFVGLSVNCDGEFIACGSETNEVYTYFSKLSKPVLTHHFGSMIDSVTGAPNPHADPSLFVSSMCWKRKTPNILVAANSQGRVKVLETI